MNIYYIGYIYSNNVCQWSTCSVENFYLSDFFALMECRAFVLNGLTAKEMHPI